MAKYEGKMPTQSYLEIYKTAGMPGDYHKNLAKLVGSWTTKTKSWMEPGKPASDSTGTCEHTMVLDGRFLRQEFSGTSRGMPYSGYNFLGYDNHTKKYVSVWLETMSTGIYYFEGTASADGRTITQKCNYDDPVKGTSVWRMVTRIKDDNTLEYEMYITPSGGKEEKMFEMTAIRKVSATRKAA